MTAACYHSYSTWGPAAHEEEEEKKNEDFTVVILCVQPFIPVPQILAYVRFLYNHFHSLYM